MTILETPPETKRRTRTKGVVFHPMSPPSRRFEDECRDCGLRSFASASGILDGFFGLHQGTDGSEPSCSGRPPQ